MDGFSWFPLIGVILSFATGGGLVALWISIGAQLTEARTSATSSQVMVAKLSAEHDILVQDENHYRIEQAEKMARLKTMVEVQVLSLSESEKRMARAIEDMGVRFDRMSERLDNFANAMIERFGKRDS